VAEFEKEGVKKVVLFNGHGGNPDVLRAFQRDAMKQDGPFIAMVNIYEIVPDAEQRLITHPSDHAGEWETSLMLACRPDLVRPDRFADNPPAPLKVDCLTRQPTHFVRPWHLYLPRSAGGDCRLSTAEKGSAIQAAATNQLAGFLKDLSDAPWSPTFPY